ncbi:MAG: hypothetical protein EZS28_047547 [Streblomastix strix]|uniref:Reverse transcriptase domain-containing protein n=1 Tax=Streblomastix strix TaxID=222440 RepID=A0A5J4TEN3_9EUKA|nr:MAG: hypothetical protein EZS28_047547 [Streblomastix strix]
MKENIVISIRKEYIIQCNLTLKIEKAIGNWRKILDAKALNKQIADFHFKMHDQNEVKQTIRPGDWSTSLDLSSAFHHLIIHSESQPYLAFEFLNNHYKYRAMLFGIKRSPIYFATTMEPIRQQIRMKTEIRIINSVDDIFLLHRNKEYVKNMFQKVMETLKFFEITTNTEKNKIDPKQTVIFVGYEWNLIKATVETKPNKRLLLLHDLYNSGGWTKTGTEITVKQSVKLIGKLNYLRLQFQQISLSLNTIEDQKSQAARLKCRNTTMIINITAIPDRNWLITKLRVSISAQLVQIAPQMTMTTDAAPSGSDSTQEKEPEMTAMAYGTWNKREARLTNYNREIKAITQSLRSFAKVLKGARNQCFAIRNDNSITDFDIKKCKATITLKKEIKYFHQTIEKL